MSEKGAYKGWKDHQIEVTGRGIEGKIFYHGQEAEYSYLTEFDFETRQDFLDWLRGHKVLDLGVGYGNLRKELIEKENFDSSGIVTVEPQLILPEFKERSYRNIAQFFQLGLQKDREQIEEIEKRYREGAVAADWTALPFADKSFDRILSCYGFPFWEISEPRTIMTLRELRRVATDDCEIKLGPVNDRTFSGSVSGYKSEMRLKDFLFRVESEGFESRMATTKGSQCLTMWPRKKK